MSCTLDVKQGARGLVQQLMKNRQIHVNNQLIELTAGINSQLTFDDN